MVACGMAVPTMAPPRGPTAGYWAPKLARNQERDRRVDGWVQDIGRVVIRVWEHEIGESAPARIVAVLATQRHGLDRLARA
jgi:G:T-mismatch repair DNA endonuclease (very short patch repair protein)